MRHNSELHVLLIPRNLGRLIEIPALPKEVVLFGTLKKKDLSRTGFKGGTRFHSLFQGVVKVLKRVGQGAIQETWVVCCGPRWGQIEGEYRRSGMGHCNACSVRFGII